MSHRLVISIQGVVNDSFSMETSDSEALPLWVKLREVMSEGRGAGRRRSRKEGEAGGVAEDPIASLNGAVPTAGAGRGGETD